ncbi:MAG: enolase [Anaerolineales bacterium]|nr:MAG: enolase [Anaerolineales bacterium]
MKVVDVQVIPFRTPRFVYRNREYFQDGYKVQTLTKIITDEGAEGYYLGGLGHGDQDGMPRDQRNSLVGRARGLLIGQDPFDRERFWHWMWVSKTPETILSVIDLALWDLQARAFGVPVYKLLGGCRDKVKAYASTYPNVGSPEDYAAHALECKALGYQAYKIHPYYFADPVTFQPVPGRPSHIKMDIEACYAVREAVGDDMVLMYDPWGTYCNYEDALQVGRVLEALDFAWYEHPMEEYRVHSYEKLTRELDIPILSPEIAVGSIYTRADWILRDASDMSRIDVLRGGITGVKKMVSICEAYGVRCEIHMAGFGNLQMLGATSEDTCEWYERGLLGLGVDYDTPPPYLLELCDPLDAEGYVRIPQEPGLGFKLNWDYINDNIVEDD